jgi:hypothetical protein
MSRRRHAAALTGAAFCLSSFGSGAVALAAGSPDVPAVDIVPVGTTHQDPNQGLWFVLRMTPGAVVHGEASLINPADVAQTVTVFARELDFNDTGTPALSADPAAGIGSWVGFDRRTVTVPAQQRVEIGYTVEAPADAEPGDHTGVLVAQSSPVAIGEHLQLVKRIATRFYVTVPGKAVVGYALRALQTHVDNRLWPGSENAQVSVVNTGNIRFVPDVHVNGKPAAGSHLVLTRSVEVYRSAVHVPWYGGPVHVRVTATANGGLPQTLTRTVWVVPWALLAVVLVAIALFVHALVFGRRRWRRHRAAQLAMRAQLAELQLLRQRTGEHDLAQSHIPSP